MIMWRSRQELYRHLLPHGSRKRAGCDGPDERDEAPPHVLTGRAVPFGHRKRAGL